MGGGLRRKIYRLGFKLKAVEFAQSVVEGGKGPGSTVGISYATQALGIADEATLAAWIKNRSIYHEQVQQAVAVSGTKGAQKTLKSLSVDVGVLPSHAEVEQLLVAWDHAPCCRAPCSLPGSHFIAIEDTASTPPRCHTSCYLTESVGTRYKRRPVITPPRYHTPSLSLTPAAVLPCMVLITGGTLGTTPTYKHTPGDDISKCR